MDGSGGLPGFEEFSGAQLQPDRGGLSPESPEPPEKRSFWTLEYYQKYFDVRTDEVVERILSSIVPNRAAPSYFERVLGVKPDLWGPFWIATTLVFAIGVSGNIANYLQHSDSSIRWQYDFHLVSYAATAIFCYTWIVPIALWAAIKSTIVHTESLEAGDDTEVPGIIPLLCLYGYSLSVYVPVSILWTIQVSWLQWLLVITGTILSGFVLVHLLLPALKRSKYTIVLMAAIVLLHFLLAAGFMLYFFHVPNITPLKPVTTPLKIALNNSST